MSNYKDIQKKSDAEIVSFVQEQREALRSSRFGAAGAGTGDVKVVRTAKKNVARSLTELNARNAKQSNKNA
ncbi:MAG: ribosomal protein L29 [Acidimicrobiales bacterium]|jgi:ribosomal protein L29